MNKFRTKRAMARTYPEWLRKLQQHIATMPEDPAHIVRIDIEHGQACAVWQGGKCDCVLHVAVDGAVINGEREQ